MLNMTAMRPELALACSATGQGYALASSHTTAAVAATGDVQLAVRVREAVSARVSIATTPAVRDLGVAFGASTFVGVRKDDNGVEPGPRTWSPPV